MKVNEKIRFLRESNNLTQDEVAEKLGMSTNGYAKIERGESRLSIQKLEQIVEVFNTDILELMSLGEKNIIYFENSESNNSLNIINPNAQDLISEINLLKQQIVAQKEMLEQKDAFIALQKEQLDMLKHLIK